MTLAALYNASYTVCSYELHDSPHPNLLTVREASLTTVIIPASVKTIGYHAFLTNQIDSFNPSRSNAYWSLCI